jgi:hypothetical protein
LKAAHWAASTLARSVLATSPERERGAGVALHNRLRAGRSAAGETGLLAGALAPDDNCRIPTNFCVAPTYL